MFLKKPPPTKHNLNGTDPEYDFCCKNISNDNRINRKYKNDQI